MKNTIWNLPKTLYLSLREWEEKRAVCVVHTPPALDVVRDRLNLRIESDIAVNEAAETHWNGLKDRVRGEAVYAIGGGLAVDAAKYLAAGSGLPLVSVPTAATVDAFFTWASGVREGGCVKYLETRPPDTALIDLNLLAAAPPHLRAAGICDVLSIATGLWDWEFAHRQGRLDEKTRWIPHAAACAKAILDGALDCAEAAGRGDPAGLKQLLDCLALEVQLCNQIGHSRPEEGSEHYFAYCAENRMGKGLPHGDLVAPGILIAAKLQGQDTASLEKALRSCHLPNQTIPEDTVRETLADLPAYCRRHNLPFGVAHAITPAMLAEHGWN